MRIVYSDWWRGWCTGPDAFSDPMHAQIPDFQYFPPEKMFERLEYLGRQDQIEDSKRRLHVSRQRIEPAPGSRY